MSDWNDPWEDGRPHGPSVRAQRLLVRVLLALRCESRRSPDADRDFERAELLANRIIAEFPRRVLPVGLAAILIVALCASFPLVRDVLPDAAGGAQPTPVATAVEAGLRQHGAAMNDGIQALRAIVGPFAAPASAPAEDRTAPILEDEGSPQQASEATAPFQKS